ncbi:hypothetical protein K4F52_000153 [Lecanicillium sp. MT-2017a]|nr:hypothetical protein K4F52_000153 [Lecanicillium sp. MT-2017a]
MPAVNHIVLASGAVVAVSVVVATAMAIYESPEVRRFSDDARRRIAMALQSLSEGINPPTREPMFNRPEDAEGFLQSRNGPGAEPGVDADEATRRSQREELMYWNAVKLQKHLEDEVARRAVEAAPAGEGRPDARPRGTSFDDFLKPANSEDEKGAFVVNSGAQVRSAAEGLRHRGEGARGLAASALYANPFADENHIDADELANMGMGTGRLMPGGFEVTSDIYSATTNDDRQTTGTLSATMEEATPALIDVSTEESVSSPATIERELAPNEYMTASQENDGEAYASIQAWAHDSSRSFYSPLPETPAAPMSEAEVISDGDLTPTDSVSIVGSGEDIANDANSSRAGETGRPYDVLSESEGVLTPASWSEVGSVISENEQHPVRA